MPVTPALRRWGQEEQKFKAVLGYMQSLKLAGLCETLSQKRGEKGKGSGGRRRGRKLSSSFAVFSWQSVQLQGPFSYTLCLSSCALSMLWSPTQPFPSTHLHSGHHAQCSEGLPPNVKPGNCSLCVQGWVPREQWACGLCEWPDWGCEGGEVREGSMNRCWA